MTPENAVQELQEAMSSDKPAGTLLNAVMRVQMAGLPVRHLYDRAREAAAKDHHRVVSYRELMANQ